MTRIKITFRGFEIISRSQCRYIVVAYREQPVTTESGTYVPFCEIRKRSDSVATAHQHAGRFARSAYRGVGVGYAVIDTVTGEEMR